MANEETKNTMSANGGIGRRQFLKAVGFTTAAVAVGAVKLPVMAGPFEENEYLKLIPIDKKLNPQWIDALFLRGKKEIYSDPRALGHIGMPVGGFFAGNVYLSGDGRLWLWNIFNRDQEGILPRKVRYKNADVRTRDGGNYIEPAQVTSPFKQGFSLRAGDKTRTLDLNGFSNIKFDGRYPIGQVTYSDPACSLKVKLNAFSPFIPLNVDDSSLPATIMQYTVTNTSERKVSAEIIGHLQNAICNDTKDHVAGRRRNRVVRRDNLTAIEYSAEADDEHEKHLRPDILFEDFEKSTYEGWTVEGTAFGQGPVLMKDIPSYQGDVAGEGLRVVNSHASSPGSDSVQRDLSSGTLRSRPFKIERNYISFLVGGGSHKNQTCINLLIDNKVTASATGRNANKMARANFNVKKFQGKTAVLQIVDNFTGGWGNIGIDAIIFTDKRLMTGKLDEQRDFGTMTLSLLQRRDGDGATAMQDSKQPMATATCGLNDELTGSVSRKLALKPGQSQTVTFAITWYFPNFYARGVGQKVSHHYASRFDSAMDVAEYIAADHRRLIGDTKQWVDTWYDSSLPYWLLDRTMANTSTLATTTCYRFKDGRFWAWEGIGCCNGTCTHVWHYAQAPGRLFPEIERVERERVNFGLGQHEDGGIGMRTGLGASNEPAHDGQCGRILGAYREHRMSPDNAFLRRIWPNVKKAVEYLIKLDSNADGLIEGAQPNTLDAAWYGKISFLQSLYLAALKAGEAMATEMNDDDFAAVCNTIAGRGEKSIEQTYNGEYFVQIEDAKHKDKIGVGPGCYIDQVFGQTWAHQVGLGRLFDREKQLSALRALWKYNFVPDVGPFRENFKQGRWYAIAGDAGLLMCTWPKGGQNKNFKNHWQYMYFNECMTGFEWQVASHMIWEGMLKEGLAVSRAIHDRYNAALRNPYNEIECSDHYARAMASYGVFQAVCGFNCHGPKGHIAFVPRLTPENFKAAFTTAEGWGSFTQKRQGKSQFETVELKWGELRLRKLTFKLPEQATLTKTEVTLAGKKIKASSKQNDRQVDIELDSDVFVKADKALEIRINFK